MGLPPVGSPHSIESMSRPRIVAGNWKMNLSFEEAVSLTEAIADGLEEGLPEGHSVVLAPPFPFLQVVGDLVAGHEGIAVAAQNCHASPSGAFTGEVSAGMISSVGAQAVIVGHSERRTLFGETNAVLASKVDAAFDAELAVIFCIGETLQERRENRHFQVVEEQVQQGLGHLSKEDWNNVVLAYEPVWAIGTGETASPQQAQEMHAHIRKVVAQMAGPDTAATCSILYGGSVKPANAQELFSKPDVDGGLIGGASLVADDFMAIVRAL